MNDRDAERMEALFATDTWEVAYVLEDPGEPRLVKIGMSTFGGYEERISALQAGNPRLMRTLGVIHRRYLDGFVRETSLHRAFSRFRLFPKDDSLTRFGSEWFRLDEESYAFVLMLMNFSNLRFTIDMRWYANEVRHASLFSHATFKEKIDKWRRTSPSEEEVARFNQRVDEEMIRPMEAQLAALERRSEQWKQRKALGLVQ